MFNYQQVHHFIHINSIFFNSLDNNLAQMYIGDSADWSGFIRQAISARMSHLMLVCRLKAIKKNGIPC